MCHLITKNKPRLDPADDKKITMVNQAILSLPGELRSRWA
jgi:hypothetical protein